MDIFQIIVPYIPTHNNPATIACMKIYTTNRDYVQSFILTHNITIYDVNVISDTEDYQYDCYSKPYPVLCNDKYTRDENTIRPYKFYSNTDHRIYTIMTTPRLIKYAKYYIGGNIADTLSFGDFILCDEFSIVNIITELVESLPHTAVAEYINLDQDNCTTSQLLHKLSVYKDIDHFVHGFDTEEEAFYEYIYHSLKCYEEIDTNEPQTITLEGYVEYISTLSIK